MGENLLRAIADIAKSGPELLRNNLKDNNDKLISALLKECRKEKVEYKIIALESTGTVLQELEIDRFNEIYQIVGDYLPKPEAEENGENGDKKEEDDDEDDKEEAGKKLELQLGALNCIGRAWPNNENSIKKFLGPVVAQLEMVARNTTRKNQLALVQCLANMLKNLSLKMDTENETFCQDFFLKLGIIISTLLFIPKYAQLRTETLQILSQAIKLLIEMKSSDMGNLFNNEVAKSLDGVIKDLGSDPSTKDTARELKTSLIKLTDNAN